MIEDNLLREVWEHPELDKIAKLHERLGPRGEYKIAAEVYNDLC